MDCEVCNSPIPPDVKIEVRGARLCSEGCAIDLENYLADAAEEHHQAEMRELERQAMEDHFMRHPHG